MELSPAAAVEARQARYNLVDCDVHPTFRQGVKDLIPYMTDAWKRRMAQGLGMVEYGAKSRNSGSFTLPAARLYINSAGLGRRDAEPEDGSPRGSDPALATRQLLDGNGVDRAILLAGSLFGLGALPDPDMAATLASAYNEWMCEKWLAFDDRYRGSLLVAPQDPAQAVAEIERVADRQGMVQIFLPLANILMGERHYWPIYAAAERCGLPVAIHPTATEGIYTKGPAMAGGIPTYYIEWHTAMGIHFHNHLLSLLVHGVFEKFPDLKIAMVEGGFAWLPGLMWRLDKNWMCLRDEVPWVKRMPSEYLAKHVRFTTQPFVEPERRDHLLAMCDMIDANRTLMWSSDYPHWDFDDPMRVLAVLPKEMRRRVQAETAIEFYGDRL